MLYDALENIGYEPLRFKSNFDHFEKQKIKEESYKSNQRYKLFPTIGYKRNRSFLRIIAHKYESKTIIKLFHKSPKPAFAIISLPTIELAISTSNYCKFNNIPYFIDIRDLWPDHYYTVIPKKAHFIIRPYVDLLKKSVAKCFDQSNGVTAISESYEKWVKKLSNVSTQNFPILFDTAFSRTNLSIVKIKEGNAIKIIYAGSFSNSFDLENVCKIISETPGIFLYLVGDGPLKQKLFQRHKNQKNIEFLGWLDSKSLATYFNKSHYAIAPYKNNASMSLPNKIYEYLSYNLPVINSLKGEASILIKTKKLGFNFYNKLELKEVLNKIVGKKVNYSNLFNNIQKTKNEDWFNPDIQYARMAKWLHNNSKKSK